MIAQSDLALASTSISPPRRTAPFDWEPGFYEPAGVWLYGNVRLLSATLAHVPSAFGRVHSTSQEFSKIEAEAERLVLDGVTLVCGIHSSAHQRAAVVPLRWGAPRIVVFSGGFRYHLGQELDQEPFQVARLWRYQWDPKTDLAVSRRAPDKLPTFACHNPTVDRLIARIARKQVDGLLFQA
ncbi:MAG: hypothetical protein KIS66_17615 [Fimbriimonadaceae bacterium]|nr:hypothetical protein [Fimbriimonadaceae bacterium]